jgi:predicted dehydrogenase/threonine dehydrogenase-like Zn-dependent dehydrogenase
MRQVLLQDGQAVVEEVPAPALLPGSVLVRVAYSCISAGTEGATLASSEGRSGLGLLRRALRHPEKVRQVIGSVRTRGMRATAALVQGKLAFGSAVGYSCAGVAVEVAEEVTDVQAGDRLACAGAGYANHAEFVAVPRNLLVHVPPALDLLPASTVTLGAIALQGVRRAQPALGEVVGVIGLGFIGQVTVQLLRAAGCRVFGLDLQGRRVDLAVSLGLEAGGVSGEDAEARVRDLTGGHGLDAVILTAATRSDEPLSLAMRLSRRKGRVVVVGDVGLGVRRADMYAKELDLLMSTSYGPGRYDASYEEGGLDYPYGYVRWTENRNMGAYLDLVARGAVRVEPLLTEVHPLEEAGRAYAALRGEGAPLTAILRAGVPQGEPVGRRQVLRPARATAGRVRVAVIGAGGFAQSTHLPNLRRLQDRFALQAVVTRTGTTAAAVARQYDGAVAATDYRQVLDDRDVDAVLICTRHHLHAAQVVDALRAGKHVFVEKPLALTPAELAEVTKAVEELSAGPSCPALMVGFNRRCSAYAHRLRELVAGRRTPFLCYYRMNAGRIALEHWVHGPEGGGRIVGEACHIFDLFRFLSGSPVERVEATAIRPQGTGARSDDNFLATLRYRDGSAGCLLYTSQGPKELAKEAMELYVDGRAAILEDYRSLEIVGAGAAGLKTLTQDKGHLAALEAFHRMCQGEAPPMALEEMLEVTETSFTVRDAVTGSGSARG